MDICSTVHSETMSLNADFQCQAVRNRCYIIFIFDDILYVLFIIRYLYISDVKDILCKSMIRTSCQTQYIYVYIL